MMYPSTTDLHSWQTLWKLSRLEVSSKSKIFSQISVGKIESQIFILFATSNFYQIWSKINFLWKFGNFPNNSFLKNRQISCEIWNTVGIQILPGLVWYSNGEKLFRLSNGVGFKYHMNNRLRHTKRDSRPKPKLGKFACQGVMRKLAKFPDVTSAHHIDVKMYAIYSTSL